MLLRDAPVATELSDVSAGPGGTGRGIWDRVLQGGRVGFADL